MRRWRERFGVVWPLIISQVSMVFVFVLAILGYMHVEGWTAWDSFYMTVITLATVGYGEVHPLSTEGRVLTTILIFAGVGNFAFILGAFSQLLVEGKIHRILRRRRVLKNIGKLEGHSIVCGYGRIGSVIVEEFLNNEMPTVVIERDPNLVQRLEEEGIPHLAGDATDDNILAQAGLPKAHALITALPVDADNVYVVLSARQLNPLVNIVARASTPAHVSKLKFAGAQRVFLPHHQGGLHMAYAVLRPRLTNIIELVQTRSDLNLRIEEWQISSQSELVGKSLREADIRSRFDVIILGIKRPDGSMYFNPDRSSILYAGDTLIMVGFPEGLEEFQNIV